MTTSPVSSNARWETQRAILLYYHSDQGCFQARSKHGNYNAWLAECALHTMTSS
jgi:hypothetical protein